MLPVITIARQYGSGGHEIGKRAAEKLNLPFYDKELIAIAAKESGYSEEVFENVDERATNSLLYSMVMGSYGYGGRVPGINDMPLNDKLFMIQAEIIKKAAEEGPCVIIGRCADYVLQEHTKLLRVFIHSDKTKRIERIMERRRDIEPKKVPDYVTKKDKQRANYYNFYSNNRWGDLANYDMSFRSSSFGIDKIVELIADAARL